MIPNVTSAHAEYSTKVIQHRHKDMAIAHNTAGLEIPLKLCQLCCLAKTVIVGLTVGS